MQIYKYQGEETCAADGMCQVKCPVKINTGELIKSIRQEEMGTNTRASKLVAVRSRSCGTLSTADWSKAPDNSKAASAGELLACWSRRQQRC
jgi:L-lactate utilization protein LutB